jgi:hypothetical protein
MFFQFGDHSEKSAEMEFSAGNHQFCCGLSIKQPGLSLEVLSHSGLAQESVFTGTNTLVRDKISVTMGTINYSGVLLCRLWDNEMIDSRGLLGACEYLAHHLTCIQCQSTNTNDGRALRAKVDFSPYKVYGTHIYM